MNIPLKQRTLKKEVVISGVGAHLGRRCIIRLYPSEENKGIRFISHKGIISADLYSLGDSFATTSLRSNGFYVEAVEHLLSCFYGLFVDNVDVEMYDDEIPLLEGNSMDFCKLILDAGIENQQAHRSILKVTKTLALGRFQDSYIAITPCDFLKITYCLSKPHPKVAHGKYIFHHTGYNYYNEIAAARTFATVEHVRNVKSMGRAKGVNENNCITFKDGEPTTTMQFPDEPVRHKILDLLGDLSLLFGMYICGEVIAINAGHKLHHKLVKGVANA